MFRMPYDFILTVFVTAVPCFLGMYNFNYISNFYLVSDSSFHIIKILGILYKTNESGLSSWLYHALITSNTLLSQQCTQI